MSILARWVGAGGILLIALLSAGPVVEAIMQSGKETASFTRRSNDQLTSASLASGEGLAFAYDPTYGQMTAIADADNNGYSLSLTSDALLHLPVSQTVKDQESGDTVLTATIAYGADGLRTSRTVTAGSQGEGNSTTDYWYGGGLHPLVVTRDGVNHRFIGKGVVEQIGDGAITRSYAHADHLGSVRVITDDQGRVSQSLSYNGDYGLTRISGETYAARDDSVASFYRFQGQEQEIFPLSKLGIDDDALSAWLDQLQLYHFPWRDYAAGLATSLETDPMPTEDSLYAAFGANPVNVTDETGGMIDPEGTWRALYPLRYSPAHRFIAPELQTLLDRLVIDPNILLTSQQIFSLRELQFAVGAQHSNPHNPFMPDQWVLGEWDETTNSYAKIFVPIKEAHVRAAERAFGNLRREQERWLDRYSNVIIDRWYRLKGTLRLYRSPTPSGEDKDDSKDDEKDDEKAAEPIGLLMDLDDDDSVNSSDQQEDEQGHDAQSPHTPSPDRPGGDESREQRPILPDHQGEDDAREPPHARGCCSIL